MPRLFNTSELRMKRMRALHRTRNEDGGYKPMPFEKMWGFPWRELEKREKDMGCNCRMAVGITALVGFVMGTAVVVVVIWKKL
jgi:hypothetical protein